MKVLGVSQFDAALYSKCKLQIIYKAGEKFKTNYLQIRLQSWICAKAF